jgi:hypothetical protein
VPVAHAYNPSYSGRSWFKASPDKIVCETLSQKNPSHKRTGGVIQGIGPECKLQYCKKQKEIKLCHLQEWMELEIAMVSEISQTEKDKYHMFSLICRI